MSITARIDAITAIPPAARSVTPPIPRSVKVELTARCDLQCFFCATGQRLREVGEMPLAEFKRLALQMRAAGVEELGLFYLGESFMYRELPEAIFFAKHVAEFPYVFLTTNGRLANPKRVKQCMAAGLDSLKFSFNCADATQFAEITRVSPLQFPKVVANIKSAHGVRQAGGFDCKLYASSIRYDGAQLTKMQAAVDDIRPFIDEHYWLPLYGQAGLTSGERGTVPVAGNPGRADCMRPPLPCWAVFTEGHITYDSKLSACCFDHDGRFEMGDLKKQKFTDAWQSQPFQALRAANLSGDVTGTACAECTAYEQ